MSLYDEHDQFKRNKETTDSYIKKEIENPWSILVDSIILVVGVTILALVLFLIINEYKKNESKKIDGDSQSSFSASLHSNQVSNTLQNSFGKVRLHIPSTSNSFGGFILGETLAEQGNKVESEESVYYEGKSGVKAWSHDQLGKSNETGVIYFGCIHRGNSSESKELQAMEKFDIASIDGVNCLHTASEVKKKLGSFEAYCSEYKNSNSKNYSFYLVKNSAFFYFNRLDSPFLSGFGITKYPNRFGDIHEEFHRCSYL